MCLFTSERSANGPLNMAKDINIRGEKRPRMKEIRNNCAQYPSSRQKWKRDKYRNEKEINTEMKKR